MPDNYKEVLIILVAGTILFLALTGIIVFIPLFYQKKKFQHREQMVRMQSDMQQEILQTQLETQEYTFRQIAGELHDNVGQLLSSVKLLLGITERGLPEVPETLKIAMATVGQAIGELRSFSKSLSSEWLNQFDLMENIRNELDRLSASGQIQGELETNIAVLPMAPQEQVLLFRVLQEAMQNAIKHSEAANIRISVRSDGDEITLVVEDDGKGFDPDVRETKGIGMMNMLHRVGLLKGTIRWEPGSISGTTVTIWLPLKSVK
jgi:signal transduction histidine kinase